MEMREIFAENLRYQLYKNSYTQADMARYMHVSSASAAKWCNGQTIPRIDKIQSLCNWLGIEKSSLLEKQDHTIAHSSVMVVSNEEARIIFAYRKLSDIEKDMVCRQLSVKRGLSSSTIQTKNAEVG